MSDETEFDLGPVPHRPPIAAELVRRLVATQFPEWAGLPVREVATPGWDNRTFHLGDEMLVRLPSAGEYAGAVAKEQRWLPVLARQLPLPIPAPLAEGLPSADYPHPWSVYRWLDGEPAATATIADTDAFAVAIADFLLALQQIDAAGGPPPGQHNWFRGGPLRTYDAQMRSAAPGFPDGDRLLAIWAEALAARWTGKPVWFHGDVAPGNLLVRDGKLSAVIDFGTSGVGDPACDLVIAWTFLPPASRRVFRERLAVDPGTWARGRGWAVWKAAITDDRVVLDALLGDE
ncbi:aminoglycoside phosphotransferase family protein [Actinoplanes oblitus]|uniref:Aminoglycoside phosphotransferase family protein n=1 Tax=Actinoplanes oblitus TaxID=3040509 RepID=A0ABY8WDC5_9ACTN|nr:aminoglycoside phosphotransferase family protein [Actinoplanes oblitus]WIM93720.1 aminoglycoside phosphotransferase family protein [Actinoplanes oblitus]